MSGGEHWWRSGEELLHALAAHEERMRRDYAVSLELIAELTVRNVTAEVGYPSLAVLLRDGLRISPAEARRRIRHASAVTEVPLVSGGTVPAPRPATAAALGDGVLGAEQVEVIDSTLSKLPPHVPDADREATERTLVQAAHTFDASTLHKIGDRIRAVLDQDSTPFPGATAHPADATATIFAIGRRAGRPTSTISRCSVADTIG